MPAAQAATCHAGLALHASPREFATADLHTATAPAVLNVDTSCIKTCQHPYRTPCSAEHGASLPIYPETILVAMAVTNHPPPAQYLTAPLGRYADVSTGH
ncbi:hypothetical protein Vretimale_17531 [Volvox reticuliferus]|uniref:Uncharacterized protein n=1 Tax=Volvox reticuliferus TaxID=1737510 RepID=A0A8J4GW10_9CHLO|nr:hypothetical protein Vretimale_17531 [Volvox reticuliferus]